ncbi:restriction endonuclease subunit S, partial [Gordonia sp. (in: high G+C Gram-positive bacteria)]|uniref:restriction endonuclease subunit S n=1 Tax=Gordonia sp. (in: high G+C Gram-positive bacteria) TaxID=84139 RepID=UPI00261139D5
RLRPGDVLVTEGSGSRDTVGTSAVWEDEIAAPVCFQNTLIRLRPRAGVTDGSYLAWWARHARLSGQIAAVSSGANILHIGSDGLKRLQIDVPELEEQRRIVDFLDHRVSRIDWIIAARREQLRAVREQFASRRYLRVLGSDASAVVESSLPWAPRMAHDRTIRRLSQIATMGTGHTPSKSNADYWVDCDIPWLTTSDVHRFRRDEIDEITETAHSISALGLANSAAVLHPAGTVALSRTASAGFSIVLGRDAATSQDFVTWTCGPEVEPYYLLAILRVMRPYLLGSLAMGSTHKTIYFPDLMDLAIPVPPIEIQRSVIRGLDTLSREFRAVEAQLSKQVDLLTEYKSSLITAAVTGELDVTTADPAIPEQP